MKISISFLILVAAMAIISPVTPAETLDNAEKLSMELEGVDLPMVLNQIAQQYHLNLVLSGDVTGKVSIRLENVDIETALEAILYPNGYNYYMNNDVIVVKPIEMDAVGELTSEVITLKYAEPIMIKTALEAVKSNKGSIVILDKTVSSAGGSQSSGKYKANRVLITDFPSVITHMQDLILQMDKQERAISIEVKIIETNLDASTKLGISWPEAATTNIGSAISSSTTETTDATDVLGSLDLNNGQWTWGALTVNQLSAVLNMLEEDGKSKLISDPHVITLENHEAVIKIQTVIPIPTINRFTEGAATQDIMTFYDEEVGISLVVTPRINEDGKITMDVVPTIADIIGYTGSIESQKPITISRSVQTRVTVADGETAALGGLLKEDNRETIRRVPVLGSIPLLGRLLFTSKSTEKETTDLIILITPRILP